MRKRSLSLALALIMLAGSSLTVSAAPKTMPEGIVFDAEFYSAFYPDVAAVLGTDEAALYQHYLTYGMAEGRLPSMPASVEVPVPTVPAVPVETPAPEAIDVLSEISIANYSSYPWARVDYRFSPDEPWKLFYQCKPGEVIGANDGSYVFWRDFPVFSHSLSLKMTLPNGVELIYNADLPAESLAAYTGANMFLADDNMEVPNIEWY